MLTEVIVVDCVSFFQQTSFYADPCEHFKACVVTSVAAVVVQIAAAAVEVQAIVWRGFLD